ncbi:uncharacterized protein LOC135955534 [Calliphora vicina]|uniref:uncharacterized protein LOC135955534 n=1 Tax=Calliphora vicina TaxID=7373 RepID=UPI00325B1DD4
MAITANKKFWTEFIDIYHSLPSLWNTKDENYNNRESRSLSWYKLVEKLQEVEPDANQDSVKRKINTFRSNFNREVRKIRQTQKEQPTEVYNPTLWYFDHLSFLLNQEKYNIGSGHYDEGMTLMGLTTAKSENMDENETMHEVSINQEEMDMSNHDQKTSYEKLIPNKSMTRSGFKRNNTSKFLEPEQKPIIDYTPLIEHLSEPCSPLRPMSIEEPQSSVPHEINLKQSEDLEETIKLQRTSTPRIQRSNLNKKSKLRVKSVDLNNRKLFRNCLVSPIPTDEAAIYGQSWACGFRKLSPQQKLFAKKAIDEILILGQLNALKLNTVQMNGNLLEVVASDEG